MDRIVLTGVGPLTPIGKGKEDFWNAVVNNFPGIKKITKFMPDQEFYGGEINDIHLTNISPTQNSDVPLKYLNLLCPPQRWQWMTLRLILPILKILG